MASVADDGTERKLNLWRAVAWSVAGLVLLLPLAAMPFTDEVDWTAGDFLFAAVLILGVGITLEITFRKTEEAAYRAGVGCALAAAFLLVWLSGAVGIIGTEDEPANLVYGGVLAVALAGVFVARLEAGGMGRAMVATAGAQALVTLIAVAAGLGQPWSGPAEILLANGLFVALWLGAAWLFRRAARGSSPAAQRPTS